MFKGFVSDFKAFLMRGNVIDLAVAFVIGAAFSAIVKSLVDNIIMSPIGLLLHNVDFSNLYITLKTGSTPGPYPTLGAAEKAGAVTLNYGLFINSVMNFVIVAFAVFLLLRVVNKLYPKPVAAATTKACPYCATDIPINAKRCPHCTSQLES
ncbi:MAG: large conductance mechanosensitive channel protein MscL [bacterium]